ncbi:hypothetical protein B0H65DRAFT_474670 [Neurospora tetraspora]|uniref:Uncharacterized protein n=1 Tax=Neurospora tetraspora TaxID=94610 RepID=A0AAE0J903_9PEZI|nr:hypothetical protein B0H65DRAFT_474670 [Neurospora tetraspora]
MSRGRLRGSTIILVASSSSRHYCAARATSNTPIMPVSFVGVHGFPCAALGTLCRPTVHRAARLVMVAVGVVGPPIRKMHSPLHLMQSLRPIILSQVNRLGLPRSGISPDFGLRVLPRVDPVTLILLVLHLLVVRLLILNMMKVLILLPKAERHILHGLDEW